MKTTTEKTLAGAPSRSAANHASGRHGRSAAAMAAAGTPLEEYPIQRAALATQRPLQLLAAQSAQSRHVAQLREIVDRGARGLTVQRAASAPNRNSTGLPDALKTGLERLSGQSLDGVRVHRNSPRPAQLQALAFAQGSDIHLGPRQEKHLPHEAWHVVQQRQGRVKATLQAKGVAINDDPGLEREADVMGARAVQTPPAPRSLRPAGAVSSAPVVQGIMTVAAFQAATPAGFTHPRKAIKAIDRALNDYRSAAGAAKLANVGALILAINAYVGAGGHAAGRTIAANALLGEATAEQGLLNALGAPDGGLMDPIFAAGGGLAQVVPLTALAAAVPVGSKDLIPGLITAAGGALNLAALLNLVNAAGAQITYLPALIPLVGGGAQLVALQALVTAAGAATSYLPVLIPMVGGAGNFAALTTLIGDVSGPGTIYDLPTLIQKAGGGANALARLHLLLDAAAAAPLTTGNGVTVKLLPIAQLANGNWAIFDRLTTAAPNFGQAGVPAMPGGLHLNNPLPLIGVAPLGLAGIVSFHYGNPQWGHFFRRHVMDTFSFNEIKQANSLWPPGFTSPQMAVYFNDTLDQFAAAWTYLGFPNGQLPCAANGHLGAINVMAGAFAQPAHGALNAAPFPIISQFFPVAAQPPNIHDFTGAELRAIQVAVT